MIVNQILLIAFILQAVTAIPLPLILTRWHTAPAVTTTQTYVTGTTTLYLPPVQIFISNGVTYTFTQTTGQWQTQPVTITSVYNDPTTQAQPTTEAANPATSEPVIKNAATPATSESPAAPTTSSANPPAQVPTTEAAVPTTSQQTTQQTAQQTTAQTAQTTQTTQATTQTTQATTPTTQSTTQTTQATTQQTQDQQTTQQTTEQTTQSTTQTTQQTTQVKTTSTSSTAGSSETSSSSANIPPPQAIVYSPYQNNGNCKTADTISSDLELISSKGIKRIRTYGTDCLSLSTVLSKAQSLGIKVNQGLWFSNAGASSIDGAVSDLIAYGKSNGWGVFDFITIGNEAINDKFLTVSDLISKISSVKSLLRQAGYNGQVTTSEPPVSFLNNPQLCTASDIDFVGINPHSFFNAAIPASQAGAFVLNQKEMVEGICGSKSVFITETGYPSAGQANGLNVPSPENQVVALQTIIEQTGGDCTILTTFDDFWKPPGPFGIEPYFGAITLFN
ncbi:family 17 glucosidase SCW11 precursor [Scheffersomyces xylosifermentans]|uniref:family 17 glucosidase SCW11 precursor n=1 Tax=Scheffersomyces xylosifermentans TaxID=1304137 RepID=UPI00315D830D